MDVAERLLSSFGLPPTVSGAESPVCDTQSITRWNDEIEGHFGKSIPPAGANINNEDGCAAVLKNASSALHTCLVSPILTAPATFVSIQCEGKENSADGVGAMLSWDSDRDADEAALRASDLVVAASPSTSANRVPEVVVEDDPTKRGNLESCSELLRACKNLMRWNNQVKSMQPFASQRSGNGRAQPNPMTRLQSSGMVKLYLTLLESNSRNFSSAQNSMDEARSDLARNASLSLFHAAFGPEDDPEAKRVRSDLVHTHGGIPVLLEILLRPNPTSLVLSLVRHVHNLVGSVPGVVPMMNDALLTLTTSENSPAMGEHLGTVSTGGPRPKPYDEGLDLVSVLVATLAWSVRSDPPFPGGELDRRSDLAVEVLRVMYALKVRSSSDSTEKRTDSVERGEENMTQIGILLCDLLHMSNDDMRVYRCKLAAVNLLMETPPAYSQYLVVNGGIPHLLTILELQVTTVVVEKTENATAVIPILVVLIKLSTANVAVKKLVKDRVFPPEAEDEFIAKAAVETSRVGGDGELRAKNMSPVDAPKGTLRWKLIRLMTWHESNSKRLASELLWTLCDGDGTEFVLRTGFGNAVHMLGIKGLVRMPETSSVG